MTLEYVENSDGVHLTDPLGNDYTLCGDSLDGVDIEAGEAKPTGKRLVTCTRCNEIITTCAEYMRSIVER